jgi:hypothetical protein
MNDHAPDRSPPTGKRSLTRRRVLARVAGLGIGATLANTALGAFSSAVVAKQNPGGTPMVTKATPITGNSGSVTTQDGTRLFYTVRFDSLTRDLATGTTSLFGANQARI